MKLRIRQLRYLLGRREEYLVVRLFFLMLVGAVLEVLGVGAIPAFVAFLSRPDIVLSHPIGERVFEWSGAETKDTFLIWMSGGLVALFVLKNAYLVFLSYANAKFISNQQVVLSKRLFRSYMHAPYPFHLQHNSAELLRNLNEEVGNLIAGVMLPALTFCMDILITTFIFYLLITVEPLISLIALGILGGTSALFLSVIRKKLRYYAQERHRHRRLLNQYFRQGIGGLRDARILGREGYFVDAYVRSADGYEHAARYHRVVRSLPSQVIETIAVGGMLLITVVLVARGTAIASFVPLLTLFAIAAVRLMPAFRRIVDAVSSMRYHQLALEAVYEDLHALESASERAAAATSTPMPFEAAIEVRDLRYRYPGSADWAVDGLTLSIPKGNAVAFVGTSGAGKTTLTNLLLGLLRPGSGAIEVDGEDVWNDISAWQRNIGFIPQSLFLSDDTIRRNIAFGLNDDEISEARVREVVLAAQLGGLIDGLPEGLDTMVGEEGVRLSGGQRQRIAIARALYHDPPILIMDEATSALDNETERSVIQSVEELRGRRTLIMIAHRLSTVKNCDTLFLMEEGGLVAAGTYDELVEHSAEFRAIVVI